MSEFLAIILTLGVAVLAINRLKRLGARRPVSKLLDRADVLILDTETTGLGSRAEILEIALVDTLGNTRYSATVMPQGRIASGASDVHGLTRAVLKRQGALNWPEHHTAVTKLLHGKTVTGWNISFDSRMLDQTCKRYGLKPPRYRERDMLLMYRTMRRRKYNKLTDAVRDEGLNIPGTPHRAEHDCRAVLAVMRSMSK